MTELHLTKNQYLEVEKLSLGAFAPLSGFMNEEQFHNVVDDMRLPTGEPNRRKVAGNVSSGLFLCINHRRFGNQIKGLLQGDGQLAVGP